MVNAFAINKLFSQKNSKILLVSADENLGGKGKKFLKLIRRISNFFPENQELKDSMSIISKRSPTSVECCNNMTF